MSLSDSASAWMVTFGFGHVASAAWAVPECDAVIKITMTASAATMVPPPDRAASASAGRTRDPTGTNPLIVMC